VRRASVWIALLPLLLIPCCWLWWWAGGLNPGVQPGRSAALMLIVGCGLGAWAGGVPRAVLPFILALGWQGLTLAWSPVPEPGLLWLVERCAALGTALGLAAWLARRPDDRAPAAAALAGLGILALTAATQGGLGLSLAIGREAPFGNVNFDVGAALPLVAIGLSLAVNGGATRWLLYAVAGGTVAWLLAQGKMGGDPCRAVWLGLAAAIATALTLRLPTRAQAPVLIGGAALLLALWGLGVAGVGHPEQLGAGSAQRVHIWRAAFEALYGPAAVIGHGPGSTIAVLPGQPDFAAAWLSVPSYIEHAHNEPLQVLLDGGLILAGLLAWGLWATIAPLWSYRSDPHVAALLCAWAAWGAQALVESHLAQPGGLLCLALLAGLSWVLGPRLSLMLHPRRMLLALLPTVVMALLVLRELAGDGGNAVSIEARTMRRLASAAPAEQLAELDRLRSRLGPLDQLDLRRARLQGRLGRGEEAAATLAGHLRRLPVDAEALHLAKRLRLAGAGSADLVAAELHARQRAALVLAQVPANPVNAEARAALAAALAGDGPAPAH
jgi:hypothetical protein